MFDSQVVMVGNEQKSHKNAKMPDDHIGAQMHGDHVGAPLQTGHFADHIPNYYTNAYCNIERVFGAKLGDFDNDIA